MPELSGNSLVTQQPQVLDYKLIGTATGTTTIRTSPCFFAGIHINNRVASGLISIYDSVGTSGTAIGTIAIGTSTNFDPLEPFMFNVRTKNALTVVNSDNTGVTVLYA